MALVDAGIHPALVHLLEQEMMLTEEGEGERRGDAASTYLAGCARILRCLFAQVEVPD